MEIAAKKLVIALDDLDREQVINLVRIAKPYAATFKVGLNLFCAYGPSLVEELHALGVDIFLDLKLHDIPMQVKKTLEHLLKLGPRFLTLHGMGGREMLRAAAEVADGSKTTLLAVSVLTSISEQEHREVGFMTSIEESVINLCGLAYQAGIQGFVSSPLESLELKKRFNNCVVVCPGIRPKDSNFFDQSRAVSPFEAIKGKADAIVVGRPITKAMDPLKAVQAINREIIDALKE